ncbi:MAG TPA: glycoside hydrolase family 28 protein [Acidobacteriaceae bacterium]|nr:glycoside hydrolase family 28 protein [Acidobacteriaceae bacterium]
MSSSHPDSRRDFFRLAGAGVTGAALGAVAGATPAQAQERRDARASRFGIFSIRDFGAVGDGRAIDSPAIHRAIDAAAAAGGGTVLVPAGTYACYSIRLKSNLELCLERGATILAAEGAHYDAAEPNTPYFMYQDYGHDHWHNSLIWGEDLHDISITGPGLIYGKGLSRDTSGPGPHADAAGVGDKSISLRNCHNVLLREFAILEGGWFGILATGVDNLTIDNLLIDTNRDGMDIDCCRNVRITNTTVNSPWDDGIVLKSSYALGYPRPTENVTISNCYVSGSWQLGSVVDGSWKRYPADALISRTGRIKFGTESNGGFLNIAISNCVFDGCQGFALETVDGAHLEDVSISNITMREIHNAPIFLRLGARLRGPKETTRPGTLRRVNIGNVVCWNTAGKYCSILSGIPGCAIEDVSLHDILIVSQGGGTGEQAAIQLPEAESKYPEPTMFGATPAYGFYVRHLRGLSMNNVRLRTENTDGRPAIILDDVHGAEFFRLQAPVSPAAPILSLRNVSDFEIRYSHPIRDVRVPKAEELALPNGTE